MSVFQYLVIHEPSDEDSNEKPSIIVPLATVIAKDERSAALQAARAVPDEFEDRLDEVSVIVRPF